MTSTLSAPIKTQLGHDELRLRTQGLGQRHRTILLLVDGRRPLSKVLSLSHQAGAETSHFEELVRLGLIEVPGDAMAPEPHETSPGGLDVLRVTSVELEVIEVPDVVAEVAVERPEQAPPELVQPHTLPLSDVVEPESLFDASAPRGERPAARSEPRYVGSVPPPILRAEIKIPSIPAAPTPAQATPRPQAKAAVRPSATPVVSSPPTPVPIEKGGDAWLQHVRDLLIDTLRIDAPLFSARIFVRVRVAQTARELITVVWEIERHLSHTRHSRDELISLQRARDLLGLGNTLVAGDSQSRLDET